MGLFILCVCVCVHYTLVLYIIGSKCVLGARAKWDLVRGGPSCFRVFAQTWGEGGGGPGRLAPDRGTTKETGGPALQQNHETTNQPKKN